MPLRIAEIDTDQMRVTLSNGSVWAVSPGDAITASAWEAGMFVRLHGRGTTRVMQNLTHTGWASVLRVG